MTRSFFALLLGALLSIQLAFAVPLLPKADKSTEPAEPVVQGGLLGAIADGLDDVSQELDVDNHVIDNWRLRADRAADEVDELVTKPEGLSSLELWRDFAILTITWLIAFVVLTQFGRFLARSSSRSRLLRERPRPSQVVKYLLVYTLPALASLIITLYISHYLAISAGRALGMSLAYATSSGTFSTSIILCLITLFDTGHKRTAVRIIRRVAPRPLFLIGFLAAWSDALTSPQIARQLGGNITSSVAAVTGLLATLAFAVLILKLRRPVAHLIRNRALRDRLEHRAVQETLRIFSALWFLPILMMILVSAIHLIGAGEESQRALQKALLTSILLIGTVFLSTVLQRMFKHQEQDARQRLRPYKELLRNLAHALLRIAMAVAFIELLGRIWGFSVLDFALRNSLGRAISDSLSSIGLILLVTWLLWVVIDTAIQEALKPTVGRRASRQPSTRVRTILPMLRNAIKIILVVICTITTMANLGINVAPLLAGAGVVGLAIGFGSQQLVQDVITGLFILIEDTIAIGDWVVLDSGHAGTVESLTIRTLRLRDAKGFVHSVPFGQIKAVTNQSRQFAYAFFSVQFSYATNVDSALKLIREVGHSISEDPMLRHSLQGPLQVFGVDSMNLNGITLTAQFRTSSGGQYAVNRAFNERLKKRVDETDDVSFAQYYPAPPGRGEGQA
ncbi:mechanosensitive ion channel [Pseudomonas sp. JQ170]|uniref:mechanosensitive ion channel family protein n=1 Tax=unclassified Pseudomonas TaxID=196821 RepID=UPI0026555976|nr:MULTISPECIES: mechanosensitive ion channel domain-containing protein [unclassified Pseudomonas]MDN7139080.1 mechanosensitive ion channel [Pseudomonas sp. JQ170]WRO77593.1 mechanosensitive ion channel domain-containing protein [Pseudomonas sp. 170C]